MDPIDLKKNVATGQMFDPLRFNSDQLAIETVINKLITSVADGDSGGDALKMSPIEGVGDVNTNTLQAIAEALKGLLDLKSQATDVFTKVELLGGALNSVYYTETETDANFATKTEVQGVVLGQILDDTLTTDKMATEQKRGVANGVASLDSLCQVPADQLGNFDMSGLGRYQSEFGFDGSTNSNTTIDGIGNVTLDSGQTLGTVIKNYTPYDLKKWGNIKFEKTTPVNSNIKVDVFAGVSSSGAMVNSTGLTSVLVESGAFEKKYLPNFTNGYYTNSTNNQRPMVKDGSGNLYVAFPWSGGSGYAIVVKKSVDNGVNWTDLSFPFDVYGQLTPSLTIDASNNLHVVWIGYTAAWSSTYQIKYCKWNGSTWTTPVLVNSSPNAYIQTNPSVAVDASNNIHVVWAGMDATYTTSKQIKYSKSTNGGTSFITSVIVNSSPNNSYPQSLPSIVFDSSNNLYVVWNGADATRTFQNIKYSKSTNGGTTWSAFGYVNSNYATSVYNYLYASMTIDLSNNLYVAWQDGSGNTYFGKFNGTSWSTIISLDSDATNTNTSHSIALDSNNNVYIVCYGVSSLVPATNQIKYFTSTNGGTSWSSPLNINPSSYHQSNPYLCDTNRSSTPPLIIWNDYSISPTTSAISSFINTASAVDDFYNGFMIEITSGTGVGQSRIITAYVGSTKTATIDSAWTTTPDFTSTYKLYPSLKSNLNSIGDLSDINISTHSTLNVRWSLSRNEITDQTPILSAPSLTWEGTDPSSLMTIADVTLTSNTTQVNITIPRGYRAIEIIAEMVSDNPSGSYGLNMIFNNDSGSNYKYNLAKIQNSITYSYSTSNPSIAITNASPLVPAGNGGYMGLLRATISNYANKYKQMVFSGSSAESNYYITGGAGWLNNSVEINTISFMASTYGFGVGTKFKVMGVK